MIAIVRGGGGGQRVMIEIIISINDENDGRPFAIQKGGRVALVLLLAWLEANRVRQMWA